jgi:hypothetical protein
MPNHVFDRAANFNIDSDRKVIMDLINEGYTPQKACKEFSRRVPRVLLYTTAYTAFRKAIKMQREGQRSLTSGDRRENAKI